MLVPYSFSHNESMKDNRRITILRPELFPFGPMYIEALRVFKCSLPNIDRSILGQVNEEAVERLLQHDVDFSLKQEARSLRR